MFHLATSFDRRGKARKLATTGMTQREIAAELGAVNGYLVVEHVRDVQSPSLYPAKLRRRLSPFFWRPQKKGFVPRSFRCAFAHPSPGPHGASSAQRSMRVRTPRSARTQQTSNVPTLKTPVTCACEATQDGAAIARFPRLARGEAPLRLFRVLVTRVGRRPPIWHSAAIRLPRCEVVALRCRGELRSG